MLGKHCQPTGQSYESKYTSCQKKLHGLLLECPSLPPLKLAVSDTDSAKCRVFLRETQVSLVQWLRVEDSNPENQI